MGNPDTTYKESNGKDPESEDLVYRDDLGYSFHCGLVKHISRSMENGKPKITLTGVEINCLNDAAAMLSREMDLPVQFEKDYLSISLATGDLVRVVRLLTERAHTVFRKPDGDTFTRTYIPGEARKFILEQESTDVLTAWIKRMAEYMIDSPNSYLRHCC